MFSHFSFNCFVILILYLFLVNHSYKLPPKFFITFKAANWLDGKHVIFGKVLEGKVLMKKIENQGTKGDGSGKPKSKVTIVDSGELETVVLMY